MKKRTINILLAIACLGVLSACSSKKVVVIPHAVSTIGTISLEDLNLQHGDYEIINTVEAEATIGYKKNKSGNEVSIFDLDNNFRLNYKKDGIIWKCQSFGIVRAGYIGETSKTTRIDAEHPEEVAIRLVYYRLINQAKLVGGDGILIPAVQTEVEQDNNTIYFMTKASAKVIKIKTTENGGIITPIVQTEVEQDENTNEKTKASAKTIKGKTK